MGNVDTLGQCALAIVTGSITSPIDLSNVNIIDSDTLDSLARRVTIQSGAKYSIRHANKDLFGGLEPMGPCLYMARVPNLVYTRHHEITELTDDMVLFRLMPTSNGLRIPAPRRNPEAVAKTRNGVMQSDNDVQVVHETAPGLAQLILITLENRKDDLSLSDALIICELLRIDLNELVEQASN